MSCNCIITIFKASASTTSCSSVVTAASSRRWASRPSPWSSLRDRILSDSTTCPNASPSIFGMSYSPKRIGRKVSFPRMELSERRTVASSSVEDHPGLRSVDQEADQNNLVRLKIVFSLFVDWSCRMFCFPNN
jgi:hypothetical protein